MSDFTENGYGSHPLIWMLDLNTGTYVVLLNVALAAQLGLPLQGNLSQLSRSFGPVFTEALASESFLETYRQTGRQQLKFKVEHLGEHYHLTLDLEKPREAVKDLVHGYIEGMRIDSEQLILGVLSDHTELEAYIDQLRRTMSHTEASLTLKDRFLSQISHELKTPLNGIAGMTQLLFTTDVDPEQKEYLQILRTASSRMNRLINNLVQYTRLFNEQSYSLNMQKVLLRDCIRQTLEVQKSDLAEKGLSVELSIANSVEGFVWLDLNSFDTALDQLIDNAVKFGREGQININAYAEADQPDQLVVEIVDEGYGFQPSTAEVSLATNGPRQVQDSRGTFGMGLGLPIIWRLRDLGCFEMNIESRRGVGTKATLRFPFKRESVEDNSHLNFQKLYQGKRALVVDDDENGRVILSMICKKLSMIADIASGGAEAIRLAKTNRYDIIYLDIQMPEINGMEVLKAIREHSENLYTPVVAVTAYALKGDEEHFLSTGFDGYIAKPVEISRFEATTQQMLQLKY